MNAKEIQAKYAKIHDELTAAYYKEHALGKEAFDKLHALNWINLENELILGGFAQPYVPPRDLEAELDSLKSRIKALEIK